MKMNSKMQGEEGGGINLHLRLIKKDQKKHKNRTSQLGDRPLCLNKILRGEDQRSTINPTVIILQKGFQTLMTDLQRMNKKINLVGMDGTQNNKKTLKWLNRNNKKIKRRTVGGVKKIIISLNGNHPEAHGAVKMME